MPSLLKSHPKIAEEWDYDANAPLTPDQVTSGSGKRVWWICKRGIDHKWITAIHNRRRTGCPFCSNRRVSVTNSLQNLFPDVAAEWHEEKNGELKPSEVVFGSNKKVWWKCANGHEWQTAINKRTGENTGCPKCSNQSSTQEIRILTELAYFYSDVRSRHKIDNLEIDVFLPSLNLGVEYDGYFYHQKRESADRKKTEKLTQLGVKVLRVRQYPLKKILDTDLVLERKNLEKSDLDLLVSQIHRYFDRELALEEYLTKQSFVNDGDYRTYLSYFPNPFPEHSLSETHPHLTEDWHYEKNAPLKPENFSKGSEEVVWWKCPKNSEHAYQAKIYSRVNNSGTGCPYCRGLAVNHTNSLLALFPSIAAQWDYPKNSPLTPDLVSSKSDKNVWWKCEEGDDHEWRSTVGNRVATSGRCPFCSKTRASKDYCLANQEQFKHIFDQWDYEKNAPLTPFDVTPGSAKIVWWKCREGDDHKWQNSIASRTKQNTGCPFCSNQRLSKERTLEARRPDLAAEWDEVKNFPIKPTEILYTTNKVFHWICSKNPDHQWTASPSNRVRNNSGCPYCSNSKVSVDNCLENSPLKPIVIEQWDTEKNGDLTPRDVLATSAKKVWWRCVRNEEHNWEQSIRQRVEAKSECPYCDKLLPSKEYNLTTEYPQLLSQWDFERNDRKNPDKYLPSSSEKVWWRCGVADDHVWEATIGHRTIRGHGCPYCSNRLPSSTNSLGSLYPELATLFDADKNGILPHEVVATSTKVYFWKCPKGIHVSWQCSPRKAIKKLISCPECEG